MRFSLSHCTEPHARAHYGFEAAPEIGFWVELIHGDELLATYCASEADYDHEHPVEGALAFLVDVDLLDGQQVEQGLAWLADDQNAGEPPSALVRAVEVVRNFKLSAG